MKKVMLVISLMCIYIIYLHVKISNLTTHNLQLEKQLTSSLTNSAILPTQEPSNLQTLTNSDTQITLQGTDNVVTKIEKEIDDEETESVTSSEINFTDQNIDEQWSIDFSDNLFFFLTYHKALTHLDVKQIDCRETMCKVDIFTNENEAIQAARDVANELKKDAKFKDHPFYFDSNPSEGVIRIEINRHQQTL